MVTKLDLGEVHQAGLVALLNGATCHRCGEPIEEWAYLYQWAHTVRDDPKVCNLLLFCSTTCLIKHLEEDSIEDEETQEPDKGKFDKEWREEEPSYYKGEPPAY